MAKRYSKSCTRRARRRFRNDGEPWKMKIVLASAILAAIYVATASMVFRLRHPWMTETQLLLNMGHMLTFSKVERP